MVWYGGGPFLAPYKLTWLAVGGGCNNMIVLWYNLQLQEQDQVRRHPDSLPLDHANEQQHNSKLSRRPQWQRSGGSTPPWKCEISQVGLR